KALEELSTVLALTTDREWIRKFLRDLLTPSEIKEIATRWLLVREIARGTTQREIARKFSLSLCKITRGSRELKKEDSAFRYMLSKIKEVEG
ncbi:MAG: Trp family transcriptional regulator, partial [Spirochaetales bacterium]